jgi:hypothetical protein
MPVPQRIDFLVEQASCLLLTMVQYLSSNQLIPNYQLAIPNYQLPKIAIILVNSAKGSKWLW